MPIKNYNDVSPREAPTTFTIKRLRTYPDAVEIQTRLLEEIQTTIGMNSEQDAWRYYYQRARDIFRDLGREIPNYHDFFISFRQARQNAYQHGIDQLVEKKPSAVYGIRIDTRNDTDVRGSHRFWHDIVLKPDDERLVRLRCPMDFGCRCNQIPVFQDEKDKYPLTPESDIPTVFPGETYKYYVV